MTEEIAWTLSSLIDGLKLYVQRFHGSVYTRSQHPSYVTKTHLKTEYNRIAAIFGFLLALNNYQELPIQAGWDARKEVDRCQLIVEAQYAKDRIAKKDK